MPRRFNWKQDEVDTLVQDYLNGKIPSARQLFNNMKDAGLRVSKNTVYLRVRADLKKRRRQPRIALLAVPARAPLKPESTCKYRVPWQSQSVNRILDSYIVYRHEKSLRDIGEDIGTLFRIPPVRRESLKNHVLERRRLLTTRHGPKLKKFDRLNFEPTDPEYCKAVETQFFRQIDNCFKAPSGYVKWDEQYDEPVEERWLQTVRSQFLIENPGTGDVVLDKPQEKTTVKDGDACSILVNCSETSTEPKMLPKNYRIRLIRHERQKYKSFIVEESPGNFYHYVKTKTITAECTECRVQWRRYGGTGQIARLVIAERGGYCTEQISGHHFVCRSRTEAEIRQIEVSRNVGDPLCADDEVDMLDKAQEMALQEINKIRAELSADDFLLR